MPHVFSAMQNASEGSTLRRIVTYTHFALLPADHFDTLFPGNGAIGDFLGPDLIKVWDAVEAAQPAQAPGLHQLSQRPKPLIIAVTHRLELVPLAVRNRYSCTNP